MAKFKTAKELLEHLGFVDGLHNPLYDKNMYGQTYKKFEIGNPEHFQNWHDQGLSSEYFEIELISNEVVRDRYGYDGSLEVQVYEVRLSDRVVYKIAFFGLYDSWNGTDYWNEPIFVKPVQKTITVWEREQ